MNAKLTRGRSNPALSLRGMLASVGSRLRRSPEHGAPVTDDVALRGPVGSRGRPLEWRIHWILRVAVGLEFIGHGAFGVMTKEAWVPYYELFGIPGSTALGLMPLTGAVDIALGLSVLLRPTRAALLYMAVWGLYTATLRPLTGEGGWELVERAYNFGVPLALLLLHGWGASRAQWLERIRAVPRLSRGQALAFVLGFRAMIAAYLIGHGALGLLTDKRGLIELYDSIGLTGLVSDPRALNELIGSFEIVLGLAVLAAPATALLVFVCAWKLATELLFVTAGAYGAGFEVIERSGAYAAPLALIWLGAVLAREEGPARALRRNSRRCTSEPEGAW